MTPARKRERHPIAVALGLALLAVPGFGLGVLAGVAWEEPGLLFGHLLGRSVDVPWGSVADAEPPVAAAERAPEALPDVAAAARPPAPAPSPPPTPSATRMRPEVLSPGAAEERFAVQVGAFGESAAAEHLAERLRSKGFDVYVSPSVQSTGARWRVRVGPLPSREQADRTALRLKTEEKLPTWVLDENAV